MRRASWIIASLLLAVGMAWPAAAEVKPHALFSDHMVLQQGIKVPVWGTASDGEEVTVKLGGQTKTATAKDGKWQVTLEPLKPGQPQTLSISGQNRVEIKDVLVGEVWIASGQSNMQWSVAQSADAQATIAAADYPQIRLFTVPRQAAAEPQSDVNAKWAVCSPETIPGFSAVAYFFGKALQKQLNVPIGLISTNVGGTPAEAWTSRQGLLSQESLQGFVGSPADPKNKNGATGLYNAMIHPLVPYAIRGAIWYQGESNAPRAYQYRTLFPAMIADWRRVWGQGDFPFLFVQLAPFKAIVDQPAESDWAELREAQLYTAQTVPNTAMAVITDVGAEKDIHPKQKEPVGQRLALAARALAYGEKDLVYSGPEFAKAEAKDGKMLLSFKHVGSGLVAKNGELRGFAIAGQDRKFVNADAKIEGNKVVVSSPDVKQPVAVRYSWANFPLGNLWNKEGLPATPFRTDEFPMITAPKQ
jgi:sialate O-acetylesterase